MALVVNIYFLIFITRQWSGESNIFSLIWSSAHGGEVPIWGLGPWPSLFTGTGPQPQHPSVQDPPPLLCTGRCPLHMFKLV